MSSDEQELKPNAPEFNERMQQRRTMRDFSNRPVAREVVGSCLRAAETFSRDRAVFDRPTTRFVEANRV